MHVYLPIAEVSVHLFVILSLGGGIGLLSGLFGVGGGFLMTPLLIFIGIPPAVAVATSANQIIGASVSGALAHWRRGNVDLKMGTVLLIGGLGGSSIGVVLFNALSSVGQIDLAIKLSYVILLGAIGGLMLLESVRAMRRTRFAIPSRGKLHQHTWLHGLPLKMRFRKSKLYISVFLPLLVGLVVGVLTAMMGVGGGFVLIPAMVYLLGMPTGVVVGTSLFQIIFVTTNVTFLQAVNTQTVDVVLAILLLVGGVVGAQVGTRLGTRLRGEQLRGLLALLVLAVCAKLLVDLILVPTDIYSIEILKPAA